MCFAIPNEIMDPATTHMDIKLTGWGVDPELVCFWPAGSL